MQQVLQKEKEHIEEFEMEGNFATEAVSGLIVIALAGFLITMVAIIGGKTYSTLEQDITNIQDANVEAAVKETSINSFEAMADLSDLLPVFGFLFVFAVLAVVVSSLSSGLGGGGGSIRSAL